MNGLESFFSHSVTVMLWGLRFTMFSIPSKMEIYIAKDSELECLTQTWHYADLAVLVSSPAWGGDPFQP